MTDAFCRYPHAAVALSVSSADATVGSDESILSLEASMASTASGITEEDPDFDDDDWVAGLFPMSSTDVSATSSSETAEDPNTEAELADP